MKTQPWTPDEPYMSDAQLEYFRERLLTWRKELLQASRQTIDHMRDAQPEIGDEADESVRIESQQFELRTRDRYRKLIRKIDMALDRIRDGSYGYCEITGEPIGVARLEARPIANLCLDAQEIKERQERSLGVSREASRMAF
ncbi:MAG: RNA polymerase-binding protein DksA [Pseudomonadota bacterium]